MPWADSAGRRALALAALIAAVGWALAPWTTLWDRDEPRFAQATVEMLESGQYLYPTFNTALRPDKPILIYWLMSLSVRVLGPTELGVRFWSPLALAAAALLTFFVGRILLSPRAGLWAMAVLALTPLSLGEGLAATTDAVLLAAITGALAAFTAAVVRGPRPVHLLALTACLAVAQLDKGPVGLAVPALAMIGALWGLWRAGRAGRSSPEGRRVPVLAALAALAAVASIGFFLIWAVPANEATFGELARRGLGHHVVERSLTPLEGHGGGLLVGLPFYFVVVAVAFAPWTLYLPAAVSAVLGGRVGGARGRALLAGWVALPFAMFTAVATKLPHYVLPLWPALALAVAGMLDAAREGRLAPRDLAWLRRGAWLFVPVTVLEAAGLAWAAWRPPAAGFAAPALAVAAALLATAVVALRRHLRGETGRGASALALGTAASLVLAAGWLLPALDRIKPVPPLAAAIRAASPASAPLATYGFDEPSLVFYVGRWPVAPLPSEAAVAAWARAGGRGVLVLPRADLERVEAAAGPLRLAEIGAARGLNVSKGRRVELVALGRNVTPPRVQPRRP